MTRIAETDQEINAQDLFSIKGKTALVTGGSSGIGAMIAQGYVECGAKVYISSRKADVCGRMADYLSTKGTCISIPGDISEEKGIKELVQKIKEKEESLHVLVNNAGASWGASLAEYPESGFNKVMRTNVNAIFFLTRELVPLLQEGVKPGDPARVINIGSADGIKVPSVENFAYSASKAAVHHLTRVLAIQLGKMGITVNAVAPGPFESKMTQWLMDNLKDSLVESCPLKRIGVPADMAGIAIYLASKAASYVNCAVIPVDGGLCLT